jgi:hypothetical protein
LRRAIPMWIVRSGRRGAHRNLRSVFVGSVEWRADLHALLVGVVVPRSGSPSRWAGFDPRARGGRDEPAWRESVIDDVSIHAPAEGATRRPCSRGLGSRQGFNPRARGGRDKSTGPSSGSMDRFQSTRPRRARRPGSHSPHCLNRFQSTRPRRARHKHKNSRSHNPMAQFQSTRPRRARHIDTIGSSDSGKVSIHAPAEGATRRTCPGLRPGRGFNPRARGGRDTRRHGVVGLLRYVSIHAPAGGATGGCGGSAGVGEGFNPRARGGRDSRISTTASSMAEFQSTRPRGARLAFGPVGKQEDVVSIHAPAGGATTNPARIRPGGWRFNPRARGGRDGMARARSVSHKVFQSTRPRGARPSRSEEKRTGKSFQSTRPRGARPRPCPHRRIAPRGFNPRARGGRDARKPTPARGHPSFNPRARGGRDPGRRMGPLARQVSIHAPAGGATRS